jgi:hypothetical protein
MMSSTTKHSKATKTAITKAGSRKMDPNVDRIFDEMFFICECGDLVKRDGAGTACRKCHVKANFHACMNCERSLPKEHFNNGSKSVICSDCNGFKRADSATIRKLLQRIVCGEDIERVGSKYMDKMAEFTKDIDKLASELEALEAEEAANDDYFPPLIEDLAERIEETKNMESVFELERAAHEQEISDLDSQISTQKALWKTCTDKAERKDIRKTIADVKSSRKTE